MQERLEKQGHDVGSADGLVGTGSPPLPKPLVGGRSGVWRIRCEQSLPLGELFTDLAEAFDTAHVASIA